AGDTKRAAIELARVIAQSPDSTQANALLVVSLAHDGKFDEADKAARAFRERAPKNPMPLYLLASVALGRNDLTGGRQNLDEALKVDPNFVPAALVLAALDRQAGNKAEAKRRYEEVVSRVPNSVPAMLGLAQLALEEKETDIALSWLDKAALADPNDLRPSISKVNLLLAGGRTESALAAARELQTRAPDSTVALQVLAQTQLASGD